METQNNLNGIVLVTECRQMTADGQKELLNGCHMAINEKEENHSKMA